MWVVVVDMDQPRHRKALPILDEDEQFMHVFVDLEEIRGAKMGHVLDVFEWLAINIINGEMEVI